MHAFTPRFARQLCALALAGALLSACAGAEGALTPAQPAPSATIAAQATAAPSADADPTGEAQATAAPSATIAAQPVATSEPISSDGVVRPGESRAIATTIVSYLRPARPGVRIVAGTYAAENDYAAALALPFGERPQHVYLKRDADEVWQVILATSMPSLSLLEAQQIPASLASGGDAYAIIDALASQMQDPRGGGVEADLYIKGVEGDYARLELVPLTVELEGGSIFLKRQGPAWDRLTAGTFFDHQTLRELGIPEELWTRG